MGIRLERGANVSLTKLTPGSNMFFAGLNWLSNCQETIDIDGSCFLLSDNGRVRNNHDFIFYNQPQDENKSVYLIDDFESNNNTTDKTGFCIDLNKIAPEVNKIVICLTIHNVEGKSHNFKLLDWLNLRVIEQDTLNEIASFRSEQELDQETAILAGEFYRHKGEWKFKAIGQGYVNGLEAIAGKFGVVLEEVQEKPVIESESNEKLIITKKKRRAPVEIIVEQTELVKNRLKPLLTQISAAVSNGVNESSTRIVLDRIFQDVLGYTIQEIKTEQSIQGRPADYVLSPDGHDAIVIEAKRAGMPLRQRQIFQATSYAAYSGIHWAILTNLVQWQFYKVSTVDKVDPHLVFTIDLQRGLDEENVYNLMLISKFGVMRRGLIDKAWLKRVCLRTETLVAAILNDDVINKIRAVIVKETGGQVTNEEVKHAIESDILKI